MKCSDFVKILFGAGLGLLVSMWQAWRTAVKERKRAEKLLALEFPAIQKAVDALYNALYEKKFISTTELPSFTFLGSSELIALPSFIAIHVWQLRDRSEERRVGEEG